MNIIKVSEAHLEACLIIAKKQYLKECERVEALSEDNYEKELFHRLKLPCTKGNGIVCMDENNVCGYLITDREIEVELNYIMIPVWGYGVEYGNRSKIVALMFQYLAMKVMKLNSKVQFNVKIYAHDFEIASYFALCQFGILCTEAIRNTLDTIYPITHVDCKELSKEDILNR